MKKSLVLAMAMALGVTASAYAANPFSDVPAGHWAYGAVDELVAKDVIDGYADGTFGGDKLITRYEMAQIVAKAMAKGANVDKLAAEFADELDTLGVRVAKLEKGADAVKITGQVRAAYADYDGADDAYAKLRSRIWVKGQINEDWTYTGMIQNEQNFRNNDEDGTTTFQRAYVEGKLGGLDVTAGRYNFVLVNGNLYDHRFDGVQATYGKDVKVTAFYGKPTNMDNELFSFDLDDATMSVGIDYEELYGAKVDAKLGGMDVTAGYTKFADGVGTVTLDYVDPDADDGSTDVGIGSYGLWNVGVGFNLGEDLRATVDYMDVCDGANGEGLIVGLNYKGAKASKPGSWGLYGNWYDQDRLTVMAHTMNGNYGTTGFDGWMVGANYALAKNVVAAVEYYDLDTKVIEENLETVWTQLVFTF